MHIAPFTEADWPEVWGIIRDVSREGRTFTYPRDVSEELAKAIWIQAPPGHTVIARDENGDILGTAKMGPNQMGPGSHISTASFMVASRARGKGVGRALGEYTLQWARENGYRGMQFNAVVETNEPAVALWKSLGFRIIGTVPRAFEHAEHGHVGLHVMHQEF